ncbi:transposase [Bacillus toyonensis]|nr:transposase [Bacillus toyonensis]
MNKYCNSLYVKKRSLIFAKFVFVYVWLEWFQLLSKCVRPDEDFEILRIRQDVVLYVYDIFSSCY